MAGVNHRRDGSNTGGVDSNSILRITSPLFDWWIYWLCPLRGPECATCEYFAWIQSSKLKCNPCDSRLCCGYFVSVVIVVARAFPIFPCLHSRTGCMRCIDVCPIVEKELRNDEFYWKKCRTCACAIGNFYSTTSHHLHVAAYAERVPINENAYASCQRLVEFLAAMRSAHPAQCLIFVLFIFSNHNFLFIFLSARSDDRLFLHIYFII